MINGSLTLGQLTSFAMYLGLMIWPMLALARMFNIVERGSAAYSRIRAMLAEAPVVNDGSEPVPDGRGELTFSVRAFVYPHTEKRRLKMSTSPCNRGRCWASAARPGRGKVPCSP